VAGGVVGVRVVLGYGLLAVQALQGLHGSRVERSLGGGTTCDGGAAGSHAIAHGDVEFELEADSSSKSA
jgi:hypothetical protein